MTGAHGANCHGGARVALNLSFVNHDAALCIANNSLVLLGSGMITLVDFRVGKLGRMSDHYRQLADNLQPDPVSAEITAIADELDNEAARLQRECVGKRLCPCTADPACPFLFGNSSLSASQ